MRRILFYIFLLVCASITAWYYLPLNIREEATALVGVVSRSDEKAIKELPNLIGESILPKDPREERYFLIEELKKDIEEIETQFSQVSQIDIDSNNDSVSDDPNSLDVDEIKEVIESSKELLEKLEIANEEKSTTENITEKIMEIVTKSESSETCECKKIE